MHLVHPIIKPQHLQAPFGSLALVHLDRASFVSGSTCQRARWTQCCGHAFSSCFCNPPPAAGLQLMNSAHIDLRFLTFLACLESLSSCPALALTTFYASLFDLHLSFGPLNFSGAGRPTSVHFLLVFECFQTPADREGG